jgi:16S rRNA (guanine527-N7)-methyltransferase
MTQAGSARDALRPALLRGLAALQIEISAPERLLDYLELLVKWNRVYNLTAVREPARMLTHHLLDSLAILPWVRGPRVLDVGTGAGLPGLVLAMARPDWQLVLLDSNSKKTRFVTQAVVELGIGNAEVVTGRIEQYRAPLFDTVIARAFSSLAEVEALVRPLLATDGRLVMMKGARPDDEIADLPAGLRVSVEVLRVPDLDAERHAVIIDRGCAAVGAPPSAR